MIESKKTTFGNRRYEFYFRVCKLYSRALNSSPYFCKQFTQVNCKLFPSSVFPPKLYVYCHKYCYFCFYFNQKQHWKVYDTTTYLPEFFIPRKKHRKCPSGIKVPLDELSFDMSSHLTALLSSEHVSLPIEIHESAHKNILI